MHPTYSIYLIHLLAYLYIRWLIGGSRGPARSVLSRPVAVVVGWSRVSELLIAIHLLSWLLLCSRLASLVDGALSLARQLLGLDLLLLRCGHLLLLHSILLLLHVELLLLLLGDLVLRHATLVVVHHLVVVVLLVRLLDHPVLLLLPDLEVDILRVLDFPVDSLDFKFVRVHLRLVVL